MGLTTGFSLFLTDGAGIRTDISEMVRDVSWSGSTSAVCRTLEFSVVQPLVDTNIPILDPSMGGAVELYIENKLMFFGHVFHRQRQALGQEIGCKCLDLGHNLKFSEAYRRYEKKTPEAVAAEICGEVGLEVGELAYTGIPCSQNFLPGSYWEMLTKMYELAGEQTGAAYRVQIIGRTLSVIEQNTEAAAVLLVPGSNLIDLSTAEDASKLQNSVGIYDDTDKEVGRVEDAESLALFGLMQAAIRAKEHEDPRAAAQAMLKESGSLETKVNCTAAGSLGLLSGQPVVIQEPVTDTYGLFRVISDDAAWNKGLWQTKMVVRLQELVDRDLALGLNADGSKKGGKESKTGFAAIQKEGEKHLGTPYVWGGSEPGGFDCSGFVYYVYNKCGRNLTRTTAEGYRQQATKVSAADARPGDLVFFWGKNGEADHIGIYVGDHTMLHCGGASVHYERIDTPKWEASLMQYGRL